VGPRDSLEGFEENTKSVASAENRVPDCPYLSVVAIPNGREMFAQMNLMYQIWRQNYVTVK